MLTHTYVFFDKTKYIHIIISTENILLKEENKKIHKRSEMACYNQDQEYKII
jgi:hypothetical protein